MPPDSRSHVATNVGDDAEAIRGKASRFIPCASRADGCRRSAASRTILALRRVCRAVDPALVHHVAVQASVLGVVAAVGRDSANVYAITGLGHAFIAGTGTARFLRGVIPAAAAVRT